MADIAKGVRSSITIEVKPTVTLESACACVMMLNMFLEDNDEYRLELADNDAHDGVKWRLTDEPIVPATGGIIDEPYFKTVDEIKKSMDYGGININQAREAMLKLIIERFDVTKEMIESVDPDGKMWENFKEGWGISE